MNLQSWLQSLCSKLGLEGYRIEFMEAEVRSARVASVQSTESSLGRASNAALRRTSRFYLGQPVGKGQARSSSRLPWLWRVSILQEGKAEPMKLGWKGPRQKLSWVLERWIKYKVYTPSKRRIWFDFPSKVTPTWLRDASLTLFQELL